MLRVLLGAVDVCNLLMFVPAGLESLSLLIEVCWLVMSVQHFVRIGAVRNVSHSLRLSQSVTDSHIHLFLVSSGQDKTSVVIAILNQYLLLLKVLRLHDHINFLLNPFQSEVIILISLVLLKWFNFFVALDFLDSLLTLRQTLETLHNGLICEKLRNLDISVAKWLLLPISNLAFSKLVFFNFFQNLLVWQISCLGCCRSVLQVAFIQVRNANEFVGFAFGSWFLRVIHVNPGGFLH